MTLPPCDLILATLTVLIVLNRVVSLERVDPFSDKTPRTRGTFADFIKEHALMQMEEILRSLQEEREGKVAAVQEKEPPVKSKKRNRWDR